MVEMGAKKDMEEVLTEEEVSRGHGAIPVPFLIRIKTFDKPSLSLSLFIYIYICMYVCIHRER